MKRGAASAGSESPLRALDAVVLDCETTGLDVRTDRVISIAAFPIARTEMAPFDRLVHPGEPIPPASTRIHGITDAMVADAPPFEKVYADLVEYVGDQVVIGHNVAFDLAILRAEAERAGLKPWTPRSLDTAILAATMKPGLADSGLETIADWLGIELVDRHTALGDCRVTADIFAKLVPQLHGMGVRTLAEAEVFSRKRADLLQRHEAAGWIAPGTTTATIGADDLGPLRLVDSFPYRSALRDVMKPPHAVLTTDTLHGAAKAMTDHDLVAILVRETPEGEPIGIVSEHDVLKRFSSHGADATKLPVKDVMSAPVVSMPADTFLYRALGRLGRLGIRHLAVTDEGGHVVGMFCARTILKQRSMSSLMLGDRIAMAQSVADLASARAELPQVARSLLAEGMDALGVAQVLSAELRELTTRAADLALEDMKAAGKGEPPSAYCVMVLGSGGRGESLLAPDQDNALIFRSGEVGPETYDPWFADFGQRMADHLDAAGIPYCKGGVMAAKPAWRGNYRMWQARIGNWLEHSRGEDILNADIFYDCRGVHGHLDLAEMLRREAIAAAAKSPNFLRSMAEIGGQWQPPTTFFGGLRADERGRLDLKVGGLLPLVSTARLLALRFDLPERSTPDRFRAVLGRIKASRSDIERLIEAHALIVTMILDQQIIDLAAGVSPTNKVEIARLKKGDLRQLKEVFSHLELLDTLLRDVLSA